MMTGDGVTVQGQTWWEGPPLIKSAGNHYSMFLTAHKLEQEISKCTSRHIFNNKNTTCIIYAAELTVVLNVRVAYVGIDVSHIQTVQAN